MSVGYNEAMGTLKSMFPPMEEQVIASILQMNGGHMEKTIDVLLQMSTDNDSTQVPTQSIGEQPRHLSGEVGEVDHDYSNYTGPKPSRMPPFSGANLPDHFLRMDSTGGHFRSAEELSQIEQDALYAKMLQDKLFLNELQQNPEFINALDQDFRHSQGAYPEHQMRTNGAMVQQGNIQGTPQSTEPDTMDNFKMKLKSMGDAAKQKFNELAMKFGNRGENAQYTSLPANNELDDSEEVVAFENAALHVAESDTTQTLNQRAQKRNGREVDELGEVLDEELSLSDPRFNKKRD